MTGRTYGTVRHQPPAKGERTGLWGISAQPHVMVRVKRHFTRVRPARGYVTVSDTLDVCRDLAWFLERYPMEMDDQAREHLAARAAVHLDRETAVTSILAGESPDYGLRELARPSRPYQQIATNLLLANGRLLLTDEVGLGKTQTAVATLAAPGALPALVVAPTHLPAQWEREINTVLPWLKTHIVRGTRPYDPTTLRGVDEEPDVLIMGYAKLAGWAQHLAGKVSTVLFDEMQELRHHLTLKYEAAQLVTEPAAYVLGLTATPVYNYGIEAFNLFDVLRPGVLGSRDEFVQEWGGRTTSSGKVLVKDPAALGSFLRDQGLMLGRTRKQVGRELPPAITVVETVDSDAAVLEKATRDATEMARLILARDTTPTDRFQASGQLDSLMRQATGLAKAPYVAAFVKLLLESEERVVLFGWHRAVYKVWLDKLAEYNPVLYTGSETSAEKNANAARFMGGDARVLIMSLRSGSGLDGLQNHTRVVVFGELDWSPQVHEQGIGRIRRDGIDDADPALVYYLTSDGGSDPAITEVLQVKRNQAEPMLSPDGKLFARPALDTDRVRMLARAVLGDTEPARSEAS